MRFLFFLLLLTGAVYASAQTASNSGFENWHTTNSLLVPDSFRTQDQIMALQTLTVSRSNESHSGQYAAAIQNVYLSPGVGVSGQLHYGSMINNNGSIYFFGWPCAERPVSMQFWYKFLRNGSDTAQASVTLTKWNGSSREIIGRGLINIAAAANSYTQANVPVTYYSASMPDSMTISFVSGSNLVPTPGTTLYIDDVSFDGLTNSISKSSISFGTVIYPNPATDISTIKFAYSGTKICTLFDQSGKKVGAFLETGMNHLIDFYGLAKGIYYLNVENEGRVERLVVVRE